MNITVNDTAYSLEKAKLLQEILADLKIDTGRGIAVAVNQKVISKSEWNTYELKDNDSVLLIRATQGG